jgi:hypothetical protein
MAVNDRFHGSGDCSLINAWLAAAAASFRPLIWIKPKGLRTFAS